MENLTELQAIEMAKNSLKNVIGQNWTFSLMNETDSNTFIWSYLFNNGFEYLKPIKYGINKVILVHQS
jgi:hypothetical protein